MSKEPLNKLGKKLRKHWVRCKWRYLALAGLLCLSYCGAKKYGAWTAAQLECNHVALSPAVLPGTGPLKIAFFSDVHNNPGLFREAIRLIRAAKPDLIIFGGDLVTATARFMRTRWAVQGLRDLKDIAPVYGAMGNHDYEKQEQVERVFATAGVPLLRNEAITWTSPAGRQVVIAVVGDHNEGDELPSACLKPAGQEPLPVILVSHDPESRELMKDYDWDLMLSGHTHGGQLGYPFTHKPICFRSDMPSGLYEYEGDRHVFVTRGVGAIFGMRFFSRPEVNILEVK